MELDITDQDRVINRCIVDSAFLAKVIRQEIEPKLFSSEVRQKILKTAIDFHTEYKRAPGIDILSEIEDKIKRKRIKSEDKEMYEEYLLKVASIPDFSTEYLSDRLGFFTKVRIVSTLSNSLLKLQDHFDIDPDKALLLIRDAIVKADTTSGRKGIESILHDPVDNISRLDYVTKFGIDPIDRQLGGGFKPTDYAIIQGYLGMGKSWAINHLAKMAVRFGYSPLVIPTEMANRIARLRFRMSFSGLTEDQVFEQPARVRSHMLDTMNRGSDIFLLSEEEKDMRVDELPSIIEDIESNTGRSINPILIDSPDDFLPPEGRYPNDIAKNTAIHTFLKNFAKNENKAVIVTAQVQRIGETKFWLGAANVGDNINKFRKATIGISINGLEREKKRWFFRLWLFKNTSGYEGAKVWARRDFERGQFITRYSRYVHKDIYDEMLTNEPIMDRTE